MRAGHRKYARPYKFYVKAIKLKIKFEANYIIKGKK